MQILGIDPGTATGFAVIGADRAGQRLLALWVQEWGGDGDIYMWNVNTITPTIPEQVVIEVPYEPWGRGKNRVTESALAKCAFRGGRLEERELIRWGWTQVPLAEVEPGEWLLGVARMSRKGRKRPSNKEIWDAFFFWFPEAEGMITFKINSRTGLPKRSVEHVRDAALIALYWARFKAEFKEVGYDRV